MFIGIVGPSCSGRHTVANLLSGMYGFTRLDLGIQQEETFSTLSLNDNIQKPPNGQPNTTTTFETVDEMLDFVTLNWRQDFVTCDVNTVQGVAMLRKRPFFLLLAVESPMMVRFKRCVARSVRNNMEPPSLEDFVQSSDDAHYTNQLDQTTPIAGSIPTTTTTTSSSSSSSEQKAMTQLPRRIYSPPYKLLSMSDLSLLNPYTELNSLRKALESLNIINLDLLRPSWDSYFMHLADLAARRSNCMKRRVGCVLVREKRVIATGYNGTPKNLTNCNEGGCERCNSATPCGKGLDRCLCMHAEENALLEAGRERVGNGATIYCNTCPCLGCAIKIVQVGVCRVIYSESYGMDELTAEVFRKAGVELQQHAPPGMKLDGRSERLGDTLVEPVVEMVALGHSTFGEENWPSPM